MIIILVNTTTDNIITFFDFSYLSVVNKCNLLIF